MTIFFSTNIPALRATNVLQQSTEAVGKSTTRLATGLRINSGADDPLGFSTREGLRSDISSIEAMSKGFEASQAKLNVAATTYNNALNAIHGNSTTNPDDTGIIGAAEAYSKAAGEQDEAGKAAAIATMKAYQGVYLSAIGTTVNGTKVIGDTDVNGKIVVGLDSGNSPISVEYTLGGSGTGGKLVSVANLATVIEAFLADPDTSTDAKVKNILDNATAAQAALSAASGSIGGISNAISLVKSNYSAMNTALRDAEGQISNVDTALEGSRLAQSELLAQNAMNVISYSRQFASLVASGAFS